MNQPVVLQAFGVGDAVFVVFLVVSLISWIANQMNAGKKQPRGGAPKRPGPQRNKQIQREIDRFLREAAGQNPRREVDVDEIEIVDSPRRRPPAKRKSVERSRSATASRRQKSSKGVRPGQELAARHLEPAVAAEHPPQTRVASEHLPHDVDKSVTDHLGVFAAQQPTGEQASQRRRTQAADIVSELRSTQGMRSAVIMQEILQRPRALRRRTP